MKNLLFAFPIFILLSIHSYSQCTEQAKGGGGIQSDGGGSSGVVKDVGGNVYFCGNYTDTAYFDNQIITTDTSIRQGYFFNKYDFQGNILWSKSIGNTLTTLGFKPIVISGGYIYISFGANYFQDGVDTLTTSQIMLFKFDVGGNLVWRKNYPSSGPFPYTGSIISDGTGGVYITGRFSDSLYINPYLLNGGISNNKTWIARINSDGTTAWAKQAAMTSQILYSRGNDIARLSNQNLVVCGYYSDSLQFDSNIMTESLTNPSAGFKRKPYIALFDENGNNIWIRGFTTEGQIFNSFQDCSYGVTVDNTDNIYFTGIIADSTAIQGQLVNADSGQIFVSKFSMNGNLQWVKMYGPNSSRANWGTSVMCDNNDVYLTGNFSGIGNFGGVIDTALSTEVFVAQLDPNGNMLSHLRTSGNLWQSSYQAYLHNSGEIYIAGSFTSQSVSFPQGNNLINSNPSTIDTTFDVFFWKVCKDDLVSVDELNQNENWFFVYPNPATESVTINFQTHQKDGILTILDLAGKQIHQTKFSNREKLDLELDDFSNGMYFVRIQTGDFNTTKNLVVSK